MICPENGERDTQEVLAVRPQWDSSAQSSGTKELSFVHVCGECSQTKSYADQ